MACGLCYGLVMAQTVCPWVSAADRQRLAAVLADRNRPQKQAARVRLILHAAERLASLVPPSFEAGCGGIDFFAGSFSFINADQFVALMKATAANAAGYAFQVAMSAMCETCMAAIETLQKKVQELNQYFGNSCQLAQSLSEKELSGISLLWCLSRV